MRLFALLSWYDEQPQWLYDTVKSLSLCQVDGVVAVDGAYALFPDAQPASGEDQRDAILEAARDIAVSATVHTPSSVWEGNEPAKRSFMFRVAEAISDPNDWYLVIDGDEMIAHAPGDIKTRLAGTDHDNAMASLMVEDAGNVAWSGIPDAGDAQTQFPLMLNGRIIHPLYCMFRAVRGLRVGRAHHQYLTPDGRELWGYDPEPALAIPDLIIDHRLNRPEHRRQAARTYYDTRDTLGIERAHPPAPLGASSE